MTTNPQFFPPPTIADEQAQAAATLQRLPPTKEYVQAAAATLKSHGPKFEDVFLKWARPFGREKSRDIWKREPPDPDALEEAVKRQQAAAQLPFDIEVGAARDEEMTLDFVVNHWLPRKNQILIAGPGSSGKSTLVAAVCVEASLLGRATLWVSSEEQTAWIRTRHDKAGGRLDAIATLSGQPTARDPETNRVTATTFGVYAHMDSAIRQAKAKLPVPLGVVVLDAVTALVDWRKGEGPNDDASVKLVNAHLKALAEEHDVCIVMIHHHNKSQAVSSADPAKVTGAAAWVNSPRLVFAVTKDEASETGFDNFVQVIKTNLGMRFGASFTTYPVHILKSYSDGAPDTVLCSARMNGEIVWGDRAVKLLVNHGEDPDAEQRSNHKKTFEDRIRHIAEAVRNGAMTRATIDARITELGLPKITSNQWIKIDAELQSKYAIDVLSVAHNMRRYKVREPLDPKFGEFVPLAPPGN